MTARKSLLSAQVWRELKLERPNIVTGVGGCVASQEGYVSRERAPCVDMVFGPHTWRRSPPDRRPRPVG